jgi:hypothetical protein
MKTALAFSAPALLLVLLLLPGCGGEEATERPKEGDVAEVEDVEGAEDAALLQSGDVFDFSGVAAQGDLCFIVAHNTRQTRQELHVYDMDDPDEPKKIATVVDVHGSEIVREGSRLYIFCNDDGGQAIIDISDPRAPRSVGKDPGLGLLKGIFLVPRGDTVYMVAGGHIWSVDAANPAALRENWRVEFSDVDTFGAALTPDGRTLCLATSGPGRLGFLSLDVANPRRKPAAPGTLRDVYKDNPGFGMVTVGRCAYYVHTEEKSALKAVDLTNPLQPRPAGTLDGKDLVGEGERAHLLAVQGDTVFVAGTAGLTFLRKKQADVPVVVGIVDRKIVEKAGGQLSRSLAIGSEKLYAVTEFGELLIVPLDLD